MTANQDILDLANEAAGLEDQTETKAGGDYTYTPPAAGKTIARFIEYIELGKQVQRPYKGQAKAPADEVRLSFELLHPAKNIKEIEQDGVMTKTSEVISFKITKKLQDKAKFKKLFDQMRYGRDGIKHMAQMLNNEFIVTVFHNSVEKDGNTTVYANLNDATGAYGIAAPYVEDVIAGTKQKVPVQPSIRGLKLFLWDKPKKTSWDSLFIDGYTEIKVGDKIEQKSKNWLQTMILGAVDYKGSALHLLLAGAPQDLPLSEDASGTAEVDVPLDPAPKAELPAASKPTTSTAAQDDLAALGLV